MGIFRLFCSFYGSVDWADCEHCFDNTNINKRNFARAFWCIYVVVVIAVVLVIAFGGPEQSLDEYIASLNEA